MPRPGREFAIAHGAQLTAQRLLRDREPELLPKPLAEIDQPPAHHAVDRGRRPGLDHRRECRALRHAQPRRLARCLAVDQAWRARRVEPQHPVAHDLQRHAAEPRRHAPRSAFVDRGQRQQAPRLCGIL